MPDRLSIGADVVEAALDAYRAAVGSATYSGEAMEAAVREALDKLGLREERRVRAAFMGPDDIEYPDELRVRLVSDWRPVDAEPARAASIPGYANGGNLASDRVDSEPSEPLSVLRDLVEAYDAWNVNNYPADGGSRNAAQAWFAEAQAVENVVERARALVEAWPSATSEGEPRG